MLFKKRQGADGLKWRLIGRGGKLFIDMLFVGSRIEVRHQAPINDLLASRRFILAFWHARILLVSYALKNWQGASLVSDSADGEIIAQILQRQGQVTVRGSTNKGGMRALARMIKEMRDHHRPGGVVPDGPQGPRHKVQPGIIYLAQKSGYPIIPVTYSAKNRWVLDSWDRFIIPCPATACLLVYGRPVHVPPISGTNQIASSSRALEEELMRITRMADRHFGHHLIE
ncbi:MAG: lysophospholipid acyltransferase family protein [Desulfatitalea sp.]|nr:lysophospholipid acyltransferase family protein [Desulfatitalea sp.]